MKKIAIHQPHYFPWLGYLDKMAKVDEFVVLDEVQLTMGSPMVRNKFLQTNGDSALLSLSVDKKGYHDKKTSDILLFNWDKIGSKHKAFFEMNYKKCKGFDEVMERVAPIFDQSFTHLLDLELASMDALRGIYSIDTPLVMQSRLMRGDMGKNNELVLNLCLNSNADAYLSGNGAREYMIDDDFNNKGIQVLYQDFEYPSYPQRNQSKFVPNLSALDLAFQCGIDEARDVFYSNMRVEGNVQ